MSILLDVNLTYFLSWIQNLRELLRSEVFNLKCVCTCLLVFRRQSVWGIFSKNDIYHVLFLKHEVNFLLSGEIYILSPQIWVRLCLMWKWHYMTSKACKLIELLPHSLEISVLQTQLPCWEAAKKPNRQATCEFSDHNPNWGPSWQLESTVRHANFKLPQLTWVDQGGAVPEACQNCKIQVVIVWSMKF